MTQAKTKTKAVATDKPAGKTKVVAHFTEAENKAEADAMAKFALRASVNAAVVMDEYNKPFGEVDLGAVVEELANGIEKMNAGDMTRAEGMLYAQAHALQSIFMNFSRRALKQEYQRNLESFLRMALKAQNQCRMTLETLATIKNPPVVFAKQANINNGGQQQVNNGAAPGFPRTTRAGAGAHAANHSTDQTELLEASDGQRLDPGAAGAASGVDPHMATVEAVHRAPQLRR